MRPTFRLSITIAALVGLAGTGVAQWRHFGESTPGEGQPMQSQTAYAPSSSSSLAHDMVAEHNAVRARVGTRPLTWSDQLAAVAQNWANNLLARGQFQHSSDSSYGENLFERRSTGPLPLATSAEVVDAWAGESRDYDYKKNSCRGVCGHYTQIVWADTRKVGCAVARGAGREVWVCEYDPPGNWVGQRPW